MTETASRQRLIASWVLKVLLGPAFLTIGAAKLTGTLQTVEMFAAVGWGQWFRSIAHPNSTEAARSRSSRSADAPRHCSPGMAVNRSIDPWDSGIPESKLVTARLQDREYKALFPRKRPKQGYSSF
jgi:hypothetical protein